MPRLRGLLPRGCRPVPAAVPAHDPGLPAVAGVVCAIGRGPGAAAPGTRRCRREGPPRPRPLYRHRDRSRRPADLERPRRRPLVPTARRRTRHALRVHRREGERQDPMRGTATRVEDIPTLSRSDAVTFATDEFGRWLDLLRGLTPENWAA